jgi:RNase P subunit RPR2
VEYYLPLLPTKIQNQKKQKMKRIEKLYNIAFHEKTNEHEAITAFLKYKKEKAVIAKKERLSSVTLVLTTAVITCFATLVFTKNAGEQRKDKVVDKIYRYLIAKENLIPLKLSLDEVIGSKKYKQITAK